MQTNSGSLNSLNGSVRLPTKPELYPHHCPKGAVGCKYGLSHPKSRMAQKVQKGPVNRATQG